MWTITVHVHGQYTCYTIMYNYNSGMYHEPRHELYYTGNTIILELNGTLETYVAKYK